MQALAGVLAGMLAGALMAVARALAVGAGAPVRPGAPAALRSVPGAAHPVRVAAARTHAALGVAVNGAIDDVMPLEEGALAAARSKALDPVGALPAYTEVASESLQCHADHKKSAIVEAPDGIAAHHAAVRSHPYGM